MAEVGVALVTGANRGIGLEVVRQLAAKGFAVVLGSRDAAGGERAAEGLGLAGVVWAATLEDDGPTGGFFRDGKPIDR